MLKHYCPRCCQPIYEGQTTGISGIYKSHGVRDLCEPCFLDEDRQIEDTGTNNLPETLLTYRENDERLNNK